MVAQICGKPDKCGEMKQMNMIKLVLVALVVVLQAGYCGHVAVCTAVISGYEAEGENLEISSVPAAVVAMNPVLDTTKLGYGAKKLQGHEKDISPCHHVKAGIPPVILFHGTADTTVPFENAERFCRLMKESGNVCELHGFNGRKHGFFNPKAFRKGNTDEDFNKTMQQTTEFLSKLGIITGKQ